MNLPRFQLLQPATVKEALLMMSTYRDRLRVLAGGTEITGRLKHRLIQPSYMLSLKGVKGLTGIRQTRGGLAIGAGATLREVADSELVLNRFEKVSQAATRVAAPAIRNVATIGGNLLQESRCLYYNQSQLARNGLGACFKLGGQTCKAVPGSKRCFSVYQGDLAPILMAFGAQATLEKTGVLRTVPVEELFTGNGAKPISIAREELLTQIILTAGAGRTGSAYERFAMRGSIDYALASAAVVLLEGKAGTIETARIILGASGSWPRNATQAADTLTGKRPHTIDDSDIQQAASLAAKSIEAVDNLILPASYRRRVMAVMVKRALEEALGSLREVNDAK